METKKLTDLVEKKEKDLEKVTIEVTQTKEELLRSKEKLDQSQDINEKLIRDIQALNNKWKVLVPGVIEKENKELKETFAVLHTVIDMYIV